MARKVKKMSNKRYFDYSLLFVIIFIVGFGLVMIYSTSSYTAQMEYGSSEYYFKKQLIFDVLGFIMMYIMYRLDYHVLRKIAPAFFALSLLLILALIPFGKTANGATRWIRFGPYPFLRLLLLVKGHSIIEREGGQAALQLVKQSHRAAPPRRQQAADLSAEFLFVIHGIHVLNQAQELIGVAHLVVIPADNLDEGIRQRDAGLGIKDRGAGVP